MNNGLAIRHYGLNALIWCDLIAVTLTQKSVQIHLVTWSQIFQTKGKKKNRGNKKELREQKRTKGKKRVSISQGRFYNYYSKGHLLSTYKVAGRVTSMLVLKKEI